MRTLLFMLPLVAVLSTARAAPPYLAVDSAHNLHFTAPDCVEAATRVLQQDGFAKYKAYADSGSVFAAYRAGRNYGFKAVIKCVPETGTLMVVVTAQHLKHIKAKATALTNALRSRLDRTERSPSPDYPVHINPDCGQGPVRMRCFNSIPAEEVAGSILYLQELEEENPAERRE